MILYLVNEFVAFDHPGNKHLISRLHSYLARYGFINFGVYKSVMKPTGLRNFFLIFYHESKNSYDRMTNYLGNHSFYSHKSYCNRCWSWCVRLNCSTTTAIFRYQCFSDRRKGKYTL